MTATSTQNPTPQTPLPTQQPPQPQPLPVEQTPADIDIPPVYTARKGNPLGVFFSLICLLVGIGGGFYGFIMHQKATLLTQALEKSQKNMVKITPSISIPPPTLLPTQDASLSAQPEQAVLKETLCFTLALPQKHEVGKENNCDLTFRTFPDANLPDTSVSFSVFLHNKTYANSEDMGTQWLALEKQHGSDETTVETVPVQVGGKEGYKVTTEYANKSVQTTHVFVYLPNTYEANGSPLTGFELLTASDTENRTTQQKELERILATWIWK